MIFSFFLNLNTQNIKTSDYFIWGSIPVLFGSSYLLDKSEVFFDTPLIGSDLNKPYKKDTVPSYFVTIGAGVLALPELFFKTHKKNGKYQNYKNIKGYTFSIALTTFITSLVKNFFGRRRPDYNSRLKLGKDLKDGKKSFFSGHSSVSFAATTYFSLFLLKDAKIFNNSSKELWIKLPLVVFLNSVSGYVAYTRVKDNKHHISDVLTGAIVGSSISILCYYFIK